MKHEILAPGIEIYQGDCREVMKTLADDSIDTVLTDSPYGLGFMGKDWDKGVPGIAFWKEMLRVAKPGAILLSMGGTRTYHRMDCAIEDAGWEVFDMIEWMYGSGFPKSHNISKAMDKKAGVEREVVGYGKRNERDIKSYGGNSTSTFAENTIKALEQTAPATPEAKLWDGWGTALKPAHEPICVAMKPRDGTYVNNALKWGIAGFNIDGGRVGGKVTTNPLVRNAAGFGSNSLIQGEIKNGSVISQGRFPANLIHDGSDEVLACFPETNSGAMNSIAKGGQFNVLGKQYKRHVSNEASSGSAARFFYCAKASRGERNAGLEGMEEKFAPKGNNMGRDMDNPKNHLGGMQSSRMINHHPTVKPIALMEYLCRLTATPTGGVVLDPFMGSGTTGIGCVKTGRDFIGIEQDPEYYEIARRRIEHWKKQAQM
ncbi:MAG: DNA-methyltransferase [Candidatus Helarchaeota archaeon]